MRYCRIVASSLCEQNKIFADSVGVTIKTKAPIGALLLFQNVYLYTKAKLQYERRRL
jgi:hypothetical protein